MPFAFADDAVTEGVFANSVENLAAERLDFLGQIEAEFERIFRIVFVLDPPGWSDIPEPSQTASKISADLVGPTCHSWPLSMYSILAKASQGTMPKRMSGPVVLGLQRFGKLLVRLVGDDGQAIDRLVVHALAVLVHRQAKAAPDVLPLARGPIWSRSGCKSGRRWGYPSLRAGPNGRR